MSRTIHHYKQRKKKWGVDLWSRRAGMAGQSLCKMNRQITISRERAEEKKIIREEVDNCK